MTYLSNLRKTVEYSQIRKKVRKSRLAQKPTHQGKTVVTRKRARRPVAGATGFIKTFSQLEIVKESIQDLE
jgi:hypothetical protein